MPVLFFQNTLFYNILPHG